VRPQHHAFAETAAAPGLMVRLETALPFSLRVGRGTAVFLSGACYHRDEHIRRLELLVDGRPHPPAAQRMPRLDLAGLPGADERWYRSGFWATLPVEAREGAGTVTIELRARLRDGAELTAPLGEIAIAEPDPQTEYGRTAPIAVCMATHEPEVALFRAQVDSLLGQTEEDWICLISDDCSGPERFASIEAEVAGDPRFVVSRSEQKLGTYRNFERALAMVPAGCELVALCDQDDRWYPDKLRVLRGALGSAQLVYSDQRLVDPAGRVLRETLWTGRRNNHTDLASLLVANSVTGAAALFRREVAEKARPFPEPPGLQLHDHWIALVAMGMGEIAYVDRPLYDYVQHGGAVTGQARKSPASRWSARAARAAYFYGYVPRTVLAQALLERCGDTLAPGRRRVLERFLAAGRNPLAFAWLAARPLRRLTGATETLGTEAELAWGIAWRHLAEALTLRREAPGRLPVEAACPPLDVDTLGHGRLARWRAGLR
jgi:glycosyltransferase involved in cell wall biosynthesis